MTKTVYILYFIVKVLLSVVVAQSIGLVFPISFIFYMIWHGILMSLEGRYGYAKLK